MPSEYEKRIRKKEKEKLAEEWDWLQQNQERSGIDVEDLKRIFTLYFQIHLCDLLYFF